MPEGELVARKLGSRGAVHTAPGHAGREKAMATKNTKGANRNRTVWFPTRRFQTTEVAASLAMPASSVKSKTCRHGPGDPNGPAKPASAAGRRLLNLAKERRRPPVGLGETQQKSKEEREQRLRDESHPAEPLHC